VTALFIISGLVVNPITGYAQQAPDEEWQQERGEAMDALVAVQEKKRSISETAGEGGLLVEELKRYEKELLRFPKKDRLRFGHDADYTYDTNSQRLRVHNEEGNSTFRINPFVEYDLSGQKTDLKFEYRWNRQYNNNTPGSDTFSQEGNIRFARKVLPKTNLSINERLTRSSVRSSGKDNKKVSWDNASRATINYDLNPKIQINLEANYTRLFFVNEDFDETGTREFQLDPNVVLQLTPKTRVTLGYRWSLPRVHTEATDTVNHEFRISYSGKITPKSTLSADVSFTQKDPNSAQVGSSDKIASSLGYLWQATPKTSLRFLYSNSMELAVSDSISSGNLLKSEVRTTSDSWSLSIRWRPYRKVNTEFSFAPSHSHSKTKKTGDANTRSRSFTFPFQLGFDVDLTRWLRLRLTYTYRHKIGNEPKTDENRAHTWFVGSNVVF